MTRDYPEHYQMRERPEREAFCEGCGSDHPSVHVDDVLLCSPCAVRALSSCTSMTITKEVPLSSIDPERRARFDAELRAVERLAKSLRGKR